MQADTVLRNGRIVTMDDSRPQASAMALRGERISAIGSDAEVASTIAEGTRVIDLRGRTVIPGLIDSHTHLELTSYSRHHWIDIRGQSRTDILATIARQAEVTPVGKWIILQGTFGQDLPERAELDGVASEHPVAVRWSMHKFQLNACALDISHIDRSTIAPPGVRIHRDSSGQPTGLIEEGWDLVNWQPVLQEHLRDSITETASTLFMRNGVTTIHEIVASATGVGAYAHLHEGDEILPRIGLSLTAAPGHQPSIDASDFASIGIPTGFGGSLTWLAATKIFVDGGRDGAFRSGGMAHTCHEWGLLTRTPQRLAQEVASAMAVGLQVWIHAIGDLAQELTVGAIEQAVVAHPGADHRTRIEHFGNEMYDERRLQRLLAAGGIPVPNPSFLHAEPDDPSRRLPPGVRKYGMRSLLGAGARPPGNSDTAGAQPFACNPWFTMQCMVERTNKNGTPIDTDEAVTLQEALRGFTVDAAMATFSERSRGTLSVGKFADFAVLNADPFSAPTSEIARTRSVMTAVGGKIREFEVESNEGEQHG